MRRQIVSIMYNNISYCFNFQTFIWQNDLQFHFSFSFSPLKNVWSSKQKYRANLLNYIALFTIHLFFTMYLVNMYLFFVFCLLVHRFTIRTPWPFVLPL